MEKSDWLNTVEFLTSLSKTNSPKLFEKEGFKQFWKVFTGEVTVKV